MLFSVNLSVLKEDVVSEARQVESEASAYLDQISRYYLQRARIITKIAKYPHIVSELIFKRPDIMGSQDSLSISYWLEQLLQVFKLC